MDVAQGRAGDPFDNGAMAGNAITRAGCWAHARRKFVEAEKTAPQIAREAVALIRRAVCRGKASQRDFAGRTFCAAPGAVTAGVSPVAREAAGLERATAAQASHGRSRELRFGSVERTNCFLLGWRPASRQQLFGTGDEAYRPESQEFLVR